jgi:hypothetical protein
MTGRLARRANHPVRARHGPRHRADLSLTNTKLRVRASMFCVAQ